MYQKQVIDHAASYPLIFIIGAGGIVENAHLPAYKKAGFEVGGIYDIDANQASKVANEFAITSFKTPQELIQNALQEKGVFDLAVPADQIMQILPYIPDGSGVLIQKPMGENVEKAQQILNLCQKKKLIAGINFQLRCAPVIMKTKEIINQGLLGDIYDFDIRVCVNTPWHLWPFLFDLDRMEILYNSIHYIDLARHILGDPESIFARTLAHPRIKRIKNARSSIILNYKDERLANIHTNHGHSFNTKHHASTLRIEGTEGAVHIQLGLNLNYPEGVADTLEYFSYRHESPGWQSVPIKGRWIPDAFVGPMAGLMDKMKKPSFDYINNIEDAFQTMKVEEAAYLSDIKGGISLE